MNTVQIERDERTAAVENASYRLGFQVLAYGLLVLVMARGFFYNQAAWDLLGLAILGSLVATFYQAYHRVITRRWVWLVPAVFFGSALAAAVVAWLFSKL